jgi:flagellar protein FliS
MTNQLLRDRYLGDTISTASPRRLVVMLYERLVRDLTQGEAAVREGDRDRANGLLTHAQDIVAELLSSLKPELWSGGPALAQLYAYLLKELIAANVQQDANRVAVCRTLVEPLRDAWREALEMTQAEAS